MRDAATVMACNGHKHAYNQLDSGTQCAAIPVA